MHYGYARVLLDDDSKAATVLPMVMSIGWNPYYKNEKRTAVSGGDEYMHLREQHNLTYGHTGGARTTQVRG